jgi:hypothetical protein
MEVVYQAKPMNMGWCVQCHRDPTDRIRPKDQVTHLFWEPSSSDPSTVAAFAENLDPRLAGATGVDVAQITNAGGDTQTALAKAYIDKLKEKGGVDGLKAALGKILKDKYHINPSTDCITCHR